MEKDVDEDSRRQRSKEHAEDEGDVARTTEQGDELTEEHSLSQRHNRAKKPYARPRQPAQDPPSS
ncbi:MAG: hypothetical protein KY463_14315 [Actinobacteria bacterium]|nr:hypothetical protein [Actinomycetota bacterium]